MDTKMKEIPKLIKIAIFCFCGHAVIVAIGACLYFYWSHDLSEFPKAIIRILGMSGIVYGLLKREKWGWWFGVVLSGVFSLAGLISIMVVINPDSLAWRPFPLLDKIMISFSGILFFSAFICLLHSKSRKYFLKIND